MRAIIGARIDGYRIPIGWTGAAPMESRWHGCKELQTISCSGALSGSAEVILGRLLKWRASEIREGPLWSSSNGSALGPERVGRVTRRSRRRHGATDGSDGHKLRDEAYSGKEIVGTG